MKYSRSIVVGSGMGGLVAARVLSDYFDDKTTGQNTAEGSVTLPAIGSSCLHSLSLQL